MNKFFQAMDHAVAALVIIMAMAMAIEDVVVVAQESPSNIVNPSLNIYEMQ